MIWLGGALAASLSGAVLDGEGQPLEGVVVTAYDERLAYAPARTDAEGRWSLELPPGRYRVRAVAEALPFADRFVPGVWDFCSAEVIRLAQDDALDGVDLVLPPAGAIEGRLVDTRGEPMVGAEVECLGLDDRVALIGREVESDEQGRFRCEGLDAGDGGSAYAVRAGAPGWPEQYLGGVYREADGPEGVVVHLPDTTDLGDFVAMDGVSVAGTVRSGDDPVAGASVHVYCYGQVVDTSSDQDGAYVADGLPSGSAVAWASLEGFGLTYAPDQDLPSSVVTVEEGDEVEGVDIELPVEAALVGRVVGEGDLSGVTLLAYNEGYTVALGAAVEADGSFHAGRLRAGIWHLFFYAADEGYLDDFARVDGERLDWTLETGEVLEVELSLRPGAALEGVVLDDRGEPVYGAVVKATPADAEEYWPRSVRTDRDGRYRLHGLVEGEHSVEIRYTPYCQRDPGYVPWFSGDTPYELASTPLVLDPGEQRELDWELPWDGEHDGMSDAWEEQVGLEPGRDDADEDPDGDGVKNLHEYWLGTDPLEPGDGRAACGGCGGGAGGLWLLPLLLLRRRP